MEYISKLNKMFCIAVYTVSREVGKLLNSTVNNVVFARDNIWAIFPPAFPPLMQ